ncbi:hypothetical protein L208DRAFT_1401851 [Tricholoma matsutake]|nr:hypothetical protein L208DRAFT_1401851 [Tricholoma matsutake 945]
MNRSSSPPPEVVLGKQTHEGEPGDGNDSESDKDDPRNATQGASTIPSISNVTASTQRYALKKKLRPEQCDELDTLLVSS